MKFTTQLTILSGVATMVAATPVFNFPCSEMPSVCQNMCYGARCMGGSGTGTAMTYDKPDRATKRYRRKNAGCLVSGGNRCSAKNSGTSGQQCDEFPFAAVSPDSGSGYRGNRCVPATENRKQGGYFSAMLSKHCNYNQCQFTVGFDESQGSITNCPVGGGCDETGQEWWTTILEPEDDDEAGDGTDDQDNDPTLIGKKKRAADSGTVFVTRRGSTINVPDGGYIGQKVYTPVPRNVTLWEEQVEARDLPDHDDDDDYYDWIAENVDVEEDEIVSKL